MRAAAAATITMTAEPIARYVVVDDPLVGGITIALGDAEAVFAGEVGVAVWAGVAEAIGAGETAFVTPTAVVPKDLQYDSLPSNDA